MKPLCFHLVSGALSLQPVVVPVGFMDSTGFTRRNSLTGAQSGVPATNRKSSPLSYGSVPYERAT